MSTETYLQKHGITVVQEKWTDWESLVLFTVVSFIQEISILDITLDNILKLYNAVQKLTIIRNENLIREKSLSQISAEISYCKNLP